jgi:hypothetical protein
MAQDAPTGRRTRFDREQERRVEWEGCHGETSEIYAGSRKEKVGER